MRRSRSCSGPRLTARRPLQVVSGLFGKIAGTSRRALSELTSAISSLDLRIHRRLLPICAYHHTWLGFSQRKPRENTTASAEGRHWLVCATHSGSVSCRPAVCLRRRIGGYARHRPVNNRMRDTEKGSMTPQQPFRQQPSRHLVELVTVAIERQEAAIVAIIGVANRRVRQALVPT